MTCECDVRDTWRRARRAGDQHDVVSRRLGGRCSPPDGGCVVIDPRARARAYDSCAQFLYYFRFNDYVRRFEYDLRGVNEMNKLVEL